MTVVANIQQKLGAAMSVATQLGDFQRSITYTSPGGSAVSARALLGKPTTTELDSESVEVTDIVFKILQNEITLRPAIDGTIRMGGSDYMVVEVGGVAGGVTWRVICRG